MAVVSSDAEFSVCAVGVTLSPLVTLDSTCGAGAALEVVVSGAEDWAEDSIRGLEVSFGVVLGVLSGAAVGVMVITFEEVLVREVTTTLGTGNPSPKPLHIDIPGYRLWNASESPGICLTMSPGRFS